jgi:hypothetical protein
MVDEIPNDIDLVLKSMEEKKMEVRKLNAHIEADKTYVKEVMQGSKEMRTPNYIVKQTTYMTKKALSLKEIAEKHGEKMAMALSKETERSLMTVSVNAGAVVKAPVRAISENPPTWVKVAEIGSSLEEE